MVPRVTSSMLLLGQSDTPMLRSSWGYIVVQVMSYKGESSLALQSGIHVSEWFFRWLSQFPMSQSKITRAKNIILSPKGFRASREMIAAPRAR